MAPSRLDDTQKGQLVDRFRAGESSQELAEAFACSAATVTRILRGALDPATYEALRESRRQRPRGRTRSGAAALPAAPLQGGPALAEDPIEPSLADGEAADGSHLAIDDADDFSADEAEFDLEVDDGDPDGPAVEADAEETDTFVVVPLLADAQPAGPVACQPLAGARLPASLYMLVDKTVELQARPLRDCPELGPLPEAEAERQALVLFSNPRQAKRHCGRSQRVIKMPDPRLLERTAPYLLAQGISRLVVEGSLYSLPGS